MSMWEQSLLLLCLWVSQLYSCLEDSGEPKGRNIVCEDIKGNKTFTQNPDHLANIVPTILNICNSYSVDRNVETNLTKCSK